MKTNGNDFAFASIRENGLTKREYFAAMAMQALAVNIDRGIRDTAFWAIKYADMLIEELNKNDSDSPR